MELSRVIDLGNLDQYSNMDISKFHVGVISCQIIAKLEYTKFVKFIDIWKDVNEYEHPSLSSTNYVPYTLVDVVIYTIYNKHITSTLSGYDTMKILLKLFQRGFVRSQFDNPQRCIPDVDYDCYIKHKLYCSKYYDTIVNLIRITNSGSIDVCNFNEGVIGAIKVLLLISKTRIIPKYVVYHKILFYYLS